MRDSVLLWVSIGDDRYCLYIPGKVDMRAAKKITVDQKLLQELVPLNALSAERFKEVSDKIVIEEILAGHYLFRKGDRDNQSIYLIEGKVNLIDGFHKVISEIEAGTDMDRYAIANQQPRHLSARAVRKCVIARIDSGLLDVWLTWDQTSTAEVVEIGAASNQDWMTRILQSEAFIKIPPSMIQSLLIRMETVQVKAGDVIIRQGECGDYFYTLHEGSCAVTRQDTPDGEERLLAELHDGDSFGEDALVSDAKRNATVSMLTDGMLMRLAKEDFIELLKNPLVRHVDYEQAVAMVDDGAVWVDVRTPDEYKYSALEDSVNIPLSSLRDELPELVFNSRYIICCDTGRRSESAGFLLSHKGLDVYVLEGGIPNSSSEAVNVENGGGPVAATKPGDQEAANYKTPPGEQEVQIHELQSVRADKEQLLAEIKKYQTAESRMKEQIELLRGELGESNNKLSELYTQTREDAELLKQLRGELCESGEKLSSMYAQVKSDAEKMQLLQQKYAALEARHEDAVCAHKLELEQLEEKINQHVES